MAIIGHPIQTAELPLQDPVRPDVPDRNSATLRSTPPTAGITQALIARIHRADRNAMERPSCDQTGAYSADGEGGEADRIAGSCHFDEDVG